MNMLTRKMQLSDAMQSLENRQEARKLGLLPKAKVSQPDASDRSRRSLRGACFQGIAWHRLIQLHFSG
jgi:hypothetical protein